MLWSGKRRPDFFWFAGQLWSASWQGALVQAQRCGTTIEPTGKHAFCWRGSHHVATVSRDGKMHATSPDVGATATCFLFHKLFSALHVWHSCSSETEKCTRRSTLERAEPWSVLLIWILLGAPNTKIFLYESAKLDPWRTQGNLRHISNILCPVGFPHWDYFMKQQPWYKKQLWHAYYP
jgi:hypothetical protein